MNANGQSSRARLTPTGLKGAVSLLVLAIGLTATPAWAQVPPEPVITPGDEPAEEVDSAPAAAVDAQQEIAESVIVVTGFRRSINQALDIKRRSDSAVDAIVAEDIAKFPDQNLAESLQRIPGVAIERDAGEGRSVTVRGLGAQFTRVRLNGMETIATSTAGASVNRDRGFDFNVFASELFSSIVVHKTAEASIDEGSLGAVIDLNTGNPLAYGAGFTAVASAQARYNDLNDDLGPRLAGLVSWVNPAETFGASASVAYSSYETPELGNNSVRWAKARFRSVDGVNCTANPADPGCVEVLNAFHPRIPRYGLVNHDRERLGATGSIQFKPTESTTIAIDGLYSNFKGARDEHWGEVLLRSNEGSIDLSNYEIAGDNNIISADLDNVFVRTERYHRENETTFYQLSSNVLHEFNESFRVNLRGGFSRSDNEIPVETSLMFDDRDATGYRYDYTDMEFPALTFSEDITDPSEFYLAEFRDRPSSQTNKFRTAAFDVEWDVAEGFEVQAGPFYRRFDFDVVSFRRDSLYCSAFECEDGAYGLPVTDDMYDIFELGEAGQPSGNTNSWVQPNLGAITDLIDLYGIPTRADDDRSVTEEVKGGWFQVNFRTNLAGMRVTGNGGVRYAKTDQSSTGIVSGEELTVDRSYEDWLPSLNINFFLQDNLILRGAIADVLTRPTLGTLTPGGSVDQFNFRTSRGNPFIEPYRATNYDAAIEWYFVRDGLLSLALFAKDIASFPLASSTEGTFADSGLPTSVLTPGTPLYCAVTQDPACPANSYNPGREMEFRTTINGPGATLKGLELGATLPFRILSNSLRNFGALGNVTLVDSDVDYTFGSGANAVVHTRPLLGLSKQSANGTVYYDDGKFSVRVSGAYRSGYITGTSGNANIFEGFGSSFNLDAAVRYALTDQLELSLDGTNLTDEYRFRWTDDFARRNYENNHFGRTIIAGVRYKLR